MLKKVLIHTRRGIKFIILFLIATFLIIGAVAFLYKPTYSVHINGQQVGYTANKSELQKRINEYIENGDGSNKNIAFVQVDSLPEYKLCLLKRNIVPNDEEIYQKTISGGIPYYRYYAILDNNEEKYYVSSFEEAEKVVNDLKEKGSTNIESISISEKYETDLKTLTSTEEVVSKLYVEPVKTVTVAKNANAGSRARASGSVNTSSKISGGKASLGISLIRPVSGTITSRFGVSSNIRRSSHTGLDIAAPTGTPVKAAASGTVTFSGWKGSYGNMLVISHGNGVQTYYGHCSKLYAKNGQTVSQGDVVASVGSTGNSTGPHLHLEIRVNGTAYNPQNYIY
ncbi:MAG: M23 family metallopeptidase [Clostridia bacterium]|nr:M23 family metallopeptidase [Clostridium sp.]MBS6252801.1 M23 family metallopeptidase [Clostridium sp.]